MHYAVGGQSASVAGVQSRAQRVLCGKLTELSPGASAASQSKCLIS